MFQNVLTWNLVGLKGDFRTKQDEYIQILQHSFERWSAHTILNFVRSSTNPDITIKFVHSFHGDAYPLFKGSNSFGHSFYPLIQKGLSGDIHINSLLINQMNDIDLTWFFTHSIGTNIFYFTDLFAFFEKYFYKYVEMLLSSFKTIVVFFSMKNYIINWTFQLPSSDNFHYHFTHRF